MTEALAKLAAVRVRRSVVAVAPTTMVTLEANEARWKVVVPVPLLTKMVGAPAVPEKVIAEALMPSRRSTSVRRHNR